MDTQPRFQQLMDQYITGTMNEQDHHELQDMIRQPGNELLLETYIRDSYDQHPAIEITTAWNEKFRQKLFAEMQQPIVHRIHFLRTAWFRYAAAITILFGIGTYLYVTSQKEKPSVATTTSDPVPVQNDVEPGGNKARLTLADGSTIILDSAANGKLAEQGTTQIEKKDGQLIYTTAHRSQLPSHLSYNTMSTPRGGQYQLTLPDGSQVWLNAESAITYPTAFTSKERNVTITGEAYFEVKKDHSKPFRVKAGEQTIEVLGTHFNVNTYQDEQTNNTTLLEGSVRIKTVHTSLTLKPGQQGQLNPRNEKLSLAVNPDLDQVMAWKNGLFNFNNADLQTVMKQLSRWYDIQIKYEGNVPDFEFKGKLPRNLQLSQVLTILRKVEVKYRIEGRTLIVSP